jgi:hypothetical protein
MTHNRSKIAGTVAALGCLLGCLTMFAGCTGSDTLDTGIVQLDFNIASANPSATDRDCIQLGLASLTVTTLDGTCSAGSPAPGEPCHASADCTPGVCEGSNSEEVLPQSIAVPIPDGKLGFQEGECPELQGLFIPGSIFELPSLVLPSGVYRIDSFSFGDGFLLDLDPAGIPVAFGQCLGQVELAAAYGDQRFFTVGEGGISTISLTLDISEFESRIVPPTTCTVLSTDPEDVLALQQQ